MIKPFDYASPQIVSTETSGQIKPFVYPEQKNYTVGGVEHGAGVTEKLRTNAESLQQEADKGVTLQGFGEGFMALPGPSDVKSLVTGAIEGGKNAWQAGQDKSFSNLGTPALEHGSKVLRDTINDSGARLANAVTKVVDAFHGTASPLEATVASGEAVMGGLNALFTPITVPLATVSGIPGVGHLADGVSALFGAIGGGASGVASKEIDRLPISNKTKELIRPLVEEVAALGAQILVGGKVAKIAERTQGVFKIADKSAQIVDAIKNDEFVKPLLETPKVEIKPFDYTLVDSAGKHDLRTAMVGLEKGGYSKGQVEAIMGKVIEQNNTGRFTPKEISDVAREMIPDSKPTFESTATIKENPNFQPKPTEQIVQPVQVTDVTNGLGKPSIEFSAPQVDRTATPKVDIPHEQFKSRVFERMKAEHPELEGDLTYNAIKLKEDANRAADLIIKDKQEAYDVAMGKKTSADVTQTSVNIALAEKALEDGNHKLYSDLIRKRSLDQTRRGQELVAERGSIKDNSTSKYVKELIAARLDILGKKYLEGLRGKRVSDKGKAMDKIDVEVAKIEKQIKAKKLDTKTALSLLDKLTCV